MFDVKLKLFCIKIFSFFGVIPVQYSDEAYTIPYILLKNDLV